jgi:diadenosine tetraphosphate (Ap4A) HIT family hydrolase
LSVGVPVHLAAAQLFPDLKADENERPMKTSGCELCESAGGALLLQGDKWRLVAVDDALHPFFLRVIWQDHVQEMTDLATSDRDHFMRAVYQAEALLRTTLQPAKINLASLGNMTPHLHWHVIARFEDDPHFPKPIWAKANASPGLQPSVTTPAMPSAQGIMTLETLAARYAVDRDHAANLTTDQGNRFAVFCAVMKAALKDSA